MPTAVTIPTQYEQEAFDYQVLREKAMEEIREMAGTTWTDHNLHDPGITLLELLSYALTDLGYRASLPLADLLARKGEAGLPAPLFSAATILPGRPLTLDDYRGLLIDLALERPNGDKIGIRNAWLQKATVSAFADLDAKKLSHKKPTGKHRFQPVAFGGFYDVLLEYDPAATKKEKESLREMAQARLQQSRNLCEDFLSIKPVTQTPYRVCAEIELATEANPFETLANIYLAIQLYLSPVVKFYSLAEMQSRNIPPDQIFEGPLLAHGFLDPHELRASALRREIRLSDVIREIFTVAGVTDARDVVVQPSADSSRPEEKWLMPVPSGTQPVLDVLTSRIVLYKNGVPFVPDKAQVMALYQASLQARTAQARSQHSEDLPVPAGTPRNLQGYTSVRHHFPKTYGVGHWGLSPEEPDIRKVQALQLHGYLWIADQLLANYLAQLAQWRSLLSTENVSQVLYAQVVYDFREAATLLGKAGDLLPKIQAALETDKAFDARRHRLLDHLISRFAEQFSEYVHTHQALFPDTPPSRLRTDKQAFLEDYPAISSHRGGAHNYTLPGQEWDTENISGFERRVRRLLGIGDMRRRNLVKLYTEFFTEESGGNTTHRFAITSVAGGRQLVSGQAFPSLEACASEAEIADTLLAQPDALTVVDTGAGFALHLVDKTAAIIAHSPVLFDSKAAATKARQQLLDDLAQPVEEGMLVIENGLLLPPAGSDAWMRICVDADCADCSDFDPYAFRLSIVLPAFAGRFNHMEFRRFAEQTIRREVPAHILPRICWVSNEDFAALETAWQQWLKEKSGATAPTPESLPTLLTNLEKCKSVYPRARLQDCNGTGEKKLMVLNQSSLGTIKNT